MSADRILLVLIVLAAHYGLLVNVPHFAFAGVTAFLMTLLALALWLRARAAGPVAAIFVLMAGYGYVAPAGLQGLPILSFLLPALVLLSLAPRWAAARASVRGWLRVGQPGSRDWFWVAATAAVSALALLLWAKWTDSWGVGAQMVRDVPRTPVAFAVGIPIFATLNAAAEELVYRGFVQEGARSAFPPERFGPEPFLALSAAAFAAAHYAAGFPNGAVGYVMVLGYGIMLGWLREKTRGLLAPWVAHVTADTVIAAILLGGT